MTNEQKLREALLPCPFCGSRPTIEYWHGGGPRKRLVHCENEDCPVSPGVTGATASKAIEHWNRRTQGETPRINTPCPACGFTSLFIANGGYLTCSRLECKDPTRINHLGVTKP